MTGATAPQLAIGPLGLEELITEHTRALSGARAEMGALRVALEAARSGRQVSDMAAIITANRLADYEREMLRFAGLIRNAATVRTLLEMSQERQALAQVPEPEPARHRHRKSRPSRPHAERNLRPLGLAVPGLAAALRHGARHAWAAHPVAAITTPATAMALTAAVVSLGHVHTLEDRTHLPAISSPPSVSAPAVPVHFASSPDPDYSAPVVYRKPAKPLSVAAPVVTVTQDPADSQDSSQPQGSSQSQDQSQQQGDGQGNGQGQGQQGDGGYQGRHRGQDGDQGGQGNSQQGNGQGGGQGDGGHGRHGGN